MSRACYLLICKMMVTIDDIDLKRHTAFCAGLAPVGD